MRDARISHEDPHSVDNVVALPDLLLGHVLLIGQPFGGDRHSDALLLRSSSCQRVITSAPPARRRSGRPLPETRAPSPPGPPSERPPRSNPAALRSRGHLG